MTNYNYKLVLKREEVEYWQKILDGGRVQDEKESAVLKTWTVKCGGEFEADIKICNGDPGPYVDAVLFDCGSEVMFIDAGDTLLGVYKFDFGEWQIYVSVESEKVVTCPDCGECVQEVYGSDGLYLCPSHGKFRVVENIL